MSEDALDPHPYPILLAEEINNMFTKIKHSYFVADIYLEVKSGSKPIETSCFFFLALKTTECLTYAFSPSFHCPAMQYVRLLFQNSLHHEPGDIDCREGRVIYRDTNYLDSFVLVYIHSVFSTSDNAMFKLISNC